MTKSVTIQVSDEVGITIEIFYESDTKCFSGNVLPRSDDTSFSHLPGTVFCRVEEVWKSQGRHSFAKGPNLVDVLTRSVIDLLTLIRLQDATDVIRDLRYEQVYGLLDAYFLMAVSEEVAVRDESHFVGTSH